MKKRIFAILTALTVFALVMSGCSSDSGGGGGGTKDPSVVLQSISIQDGDQNVVPGGAYEEDPTLIEDLAEINLRSPGTGEKEVTLTLGSTKSSAKIIVIGEDETITKAAVDSAPAYASGNKPKYEFNDGDQIFVKVTSQSGKVKYYGYKVLIGWDATLANIIFNDDNDDISVTSLGTPQDTVAAHTNATQGVMQFAVKQPTDGFKVTALVKDATTEGSTITNHAQAAISKDGTNWDTLTNGSKVWFDEIDYLYVQVKSYKEVTTAGTGAIKYYKIQVVPLRYVDIPLATVETIDAASPDPIWSDSTKTTAWLPINRINTTETDSILEDMEADIRTFGRAKLCFDAEGVYIYAQVWEKNINTTITSSGSNNHTNSSVELFICESAVRTGTVASAPNENGGQYRLNANGVRSGPQSSQLDAFNALDKSDAKIYNSGFTAAMGDDVTDTFPNIATDTVIDSGYVVIFQVPWLFPDRYPIVDHKNITLEIQINAMGSEVGSTRAGILNWNSASSNCYMSVENFGLGFLEFKGEQLGPMPPLVKKQPKSIRRPLNGTFPELSVEGEAPDNGQITYQWYQADDANYTNPSPISGATGDTYTPDFDTSTVIIYYVYAEITNNVNSKQIVRKTKTAALIVYDPDDLPPETDLLDEPYVTVLPGGYQTILNLPFTVNLGDFTRIEIWYTADNIEEVGNYNNDFFIEVFGSDGQRINPPSGYQGGPNYNADGNLEDDDGNFAGQYYTITDEYDAAVGGGSAKIEIKNKDAANKGKEVTISKVVLTNN